MIVPVESRVWSVENTRWPVSAAISVIEVVSASRISPTNIMSGSSRRAARNPSWNDFTSLPISRCDIIEFLWCSTYSIGSSILITRTARSAAIRSINDAIVVDLPAPVTPVSSTRPDCRLIISCHTLFGNPISSTRGTSLLKALIAAAIPSFSLNTFILKCRLL